MKLSRHARFLYQPCAPLGKNGRMVTNSPAHWRLAKEAAIEGTVLLKNDGGLLPLIKGTKLALFGMGTFDYVKGGGGSGRVYPAYFRNIYEGFKEKSTRIQIFEPLSRFYYDYAADKMNLLREDQILPEPPGVQFLSCVLFQKSS